MTIFFFFASNCTMCQIASTWKGLPDATLHELPSPCWLSCKSEVSKKVNHAEIQELGFL